VTEVHAAVRVHVGLELLPDTCVVEHALAVGADPDPALERLHLSERGLELAVAGLRFFEEAAGAFTLRRPRFADIQASGAEGSLSPLSI